MEGTELDGALLGMLETETLGDADGYKVLGDLDGDLEGAVTGLLEVGDLFSGVGCVVGELATVERTLG